MEHPDRADQSPEPKTSFFFPYIFGSEKGYKREFLLPDSSTIAVANPVVGKSELARGGDPLVSSALPGGADYPISRRAFSCAGLATVGTLALSLGNPARARANLEVPREGSDEKEFRLLACWFVSQVLGEDFRLTNDDIEQVDSPAPTSNKFHNSFTDGWTITNKAKHFIDRKVRGFDCIFGLVLYLRLPDLSSRAIDQVKREEKVLRSAMLPHGLRRPLKGPDKRTLEKVETAYDIKVAPEDVGYVQTLHDKSGNEHLGFEVKRGEKKQFLLS